MVKGDFVRYGSGPTAVMKIEHVSKNHGGGRDRYYGVNACGASVGAYEFDCKAATLDEMKTWNQMTDERLENARRANG